MGSATILCIDDEPTGLILRKMLLEGEGYSVLLASSGQEGLAMLQSSHVEAVVLDYRMPHMSGDEVAVQIRQRWPSIPIILLSGYPQDVPKDMLSKVNAFIWKGGDPGELLSAIRSLLDPEASVRTSNSLPAQEPQSLLKDQGRHPDLLADRHGTK
jgi:CheY-like chemotaxis protein